MSAELAPNDRLLGRVLGDRYQILRRLGEGAMGVVYKARHVKVGRMFAIKVLHQRVLADTKVARRFEREAELAGRLRHPNVVGVVDVGDVDGTRYMVMDFAEGPDLAKLLDEAPMPRERITHLVRQLLEGLYHAHEQGLIHRDFKPENVIVERDAHGAEVPRIVDFGIALLREGGDSSDGVGRLTTNGLVLGTPHYMAPEQAVADPIDHRIDLFALGIVIYEMLSGRLPFDGNGAEVARANLLVDPPAISRRVPHLEVDPLLEAFARRLMAKSRSHRPATAKAARELLDLIERDRSAAARVLGVPVARSGRAAAMTEPVIAVDTGPLDSSATTPMKPTPKPSAPITMPGRLAVPSSTGGDPIAAAWGAAGDASAGAEVAGAEGPAAVYPGQIVRAPAGVPYRGVYTYGAPARDTDLRTPLGWPVAAYPGQRRWWLIGGIVIGTASIAAAAILSLTGGSRDQPAIDRTAAAGPAADAVTAARPAAVTQTPGGGPTAAPALGAPAAPQGPGMDPAPAPGATAAPQAAGENSPPAPGAAAALRALRAPRVDPRAAPAIGAAGAHAADRKPRDGSSDGRRPSAPPGRGIDQAASPESEPVTHPEMAPAARGAPVSAAAPVAPRQPPRDLDAAGPDARTAKPDAPRAAASPAPVGIAPGALGVLFDTVGREIRQLPAEDQIDLMGRLSRVDIMTEMREPGVRRDRVAAELTQIRDEVRRRRGGHKTQ